MGQLLFPVQETNATSRFLVALKLSRASPGLHQCHFKILNAFIIKIKIYLKFVEIV